MKKPLKKIFLCASLLTLMSCSQCQAGEAKRKSLAAISATIQPFKLVAAVVYYALDIVQDGIHHAIQRDLDRENNQRLVNAEIEKAKAAPVAPSSPLAEAEVQPPDATPEAEVNDPR